MASYPAFIIAKKPIKLPYHVGINLNDLKFAVEVLCSERPVGSRACKRQ